MMKDIIKVPRFTAENGFITTQIHSAVMSRIRSTQNNPEIIFRKLLWYKGVRYTINDKMIAGKPDIVIKKHKILIFIDGDFWHGYNWSEKKDKIKANRAYWIPKIERNMQRDEKNNLFLKEMGYTVLRVWEHEIKKNIEGCVNVVLDAINKKSQHSSAGSGNVTL